MISFPTITLSSPGEIAFHIGSWPIRWYGVLIAIAFLIAYFLAEKILIHNCMSEVTSLLLQHFHDMMFWILVFSIIFARLWFVVLSWDYYKDHIDEVIKIWHGGQSIHGGMFGTILACLVYSKLNKIPFYKYIDVIAVIAPLGQAIGRWGNFFNNEAFGKPVSDWFIRLNIPQEFRPEKYLQNNFFHPTFLYESILDVSLFIFLYKKYPKWKNKPGKTFWVYLLGYSIIRFFLEFLRVDSLCLIGNIPSAHIVSVIIIVISLYFLFKR